MHFHLCNRMYLKKQFSICIYEMWASQVLITTSRMIWVPKTVPWGHILETKQVLGFIRPDIRNTTTTTIIALMKVALKKINEKGEKKIKQMKKEGQQNCIHNWYNSFNLIQHGNFHNFSDITVKTKFCFSEMTPKGRPE